MQSSTSLDFVDCVGSDLLLAMNCLDLGDQGQGIQAAGVANGDTKSIDTHHLTAARNFPSSVVDSLEPGVSATEPSASTTSPQGEDFLPLAALAPPPSCTPAWLAAQQQQARVQNEHYPARIHSLEEAIDRLRRGNGAPRGEHEGVAADRRNDRSCFRVGGGSGVVGRIRGEENSRDFPLQGTNSSLCANAPGTQSTAFMTLERSHSRGPSPGGSRRHGAGGMGSARGTPHLDESWTTVLNAPAGAELMEFLSEQPSRALVLWNVEAISEEVLRASCEVYGSLYYLRAEHQHWKRVVFIAYYDIRDAMNAHQSLGRDLSQHLFQDVSRHRPFFDFFLFGVDFAWMVAALLNTPSET